MATRVTPVVIAAAVLAAGSAVQAASLNYSQTFQTTGVQATADGQAFADYAGWTFYDKAVQPSTASIHVDTAGELVISDNSVGAGSGKLAGLISAQTLVGQSNFDPAAGPLTVSAELGSRSSAPTGSFNVGLVIGNLAFVIHPGYSGGAFRTESLNATANGPISNTNIGFTPGKGDSFTTMSITLTDPGTSDYHFDVTVGSWSNSYDIAKSIVGTLNQVGVRMEGLAPESGSFRNFSAVQAAPVPAPMALGGGAALLGMMAMTRRR